MFTLFPQETITFPFERAKHLKECLNIKNSIFPQIETSHALIKELIRYFNPQWATRMNAHTNNPLNLRETSNSSIVLEVILPWTFVYLEISMSLVDAQCIFLIF